MKTRSQCRVSDTQVTVKTLGPLVYFFCFLSSRNSENRLVVNTALIRACVVCEVVNGLPI